MKSSCSYSHFLYGIQQQLGLNPYLMVQSILWEEIFEGYMERFFPSALTSERRRGIISFKHGEDESLYNA